jgi:hypothetical protein
MVASLAEWVDLDGCLLLADDPFEGLVLDEDHRWILSSRPGLGLTRRAARTGSRSYRTGVRRTPVRVDNLVDESVDKPPTRDRGIGPTMCVHRLPRAHLRGDRELLYGVRG